MTGVLKSIKRSTKTFLVIAFHRGSEYKTFGVKEQDQIIRIFADTVFRPHDKTREAGFSQPDFRGVWNQVSGKRLNQACGDTQSVVLTRDYEDFKLLHDLVLLARGHHPGILVVRRDNDPTRDMSPPDNRPCHSERSRTWQLPTRI